MLEVVFIRNNKDEVVSRLSKRIKGAEDIVENVLQLDISRRKSQAKLDDTASELNKLSKDIGKFYKSGQIEKANLIKLESSDLKEKKAILTEELNNKTATLQDLLYQIPNLPHSSVPNGNSDNDNEVVFSYGSIPKLHQNALPHWELAKKFDIIDFELGNKITGAGFPVYKGKGARLQRALINYFLDKNIAAGYNLSLIHI